MYSSKTNKICLRNTNIRRQFGFLNSLNIYNFESRILNYSQNRSSQSVDELVEINRQKYSIHFQNTLGFYLEYDWRTPDFQTGYQKKI